jgi:hypothetical protein
MNKQLSGFVINFYVSLSTRFMALREVHNSLGHSKSNIMGIDGSDVIESISLRLGEIVAGISITNPMN